MVAQYIKPGAHHIKPQILKSESMNFFHHFFMRHFLFIQKSYILHFGMQSSDKNLKILVSDAFIPRIFHRICIFLNYSCFAKKNASQMSHFAN